MQQRANIGDKMCSLVKNILCFCMIEANFRKRSKVEVLMMHRDFRYSISRMGVSIMRVKDMRILCLKTCTFKTSRTCFVRINTLC